MRSPTPWVAALLVLTVLAGTAPLAGGRFVDPLPYTFDPVTNAAAMPGAHLAGMGSGIVLALDVTTGLPLWSQAADTLPVTGLVADGDTVFASFGQKNVTRGRIVALDAAQGGLVRWDVPMAAAAVEIDAESGLVVRALSNGSVARVSPQDGRILREVVLGSPVWDLDLRGGRALVAAGGELVLLNGEDLSVVARTPLDALRVGLVTDGAVALTAEGALRRFTLAGSAFTADAAPPGGPTNLTALATGHGRVVVGDALSLIHVFSETLQPVLPPISAYANGVADIHLAGPEEAIVAFQGGWLGVVALRAQPVVLLSWPQPGRFIASPLHFEWFYAHPTAAAGATVDYRVQLREAGATTWREVAQGTSPISPATQRKLLPIDLRSFPSGSHLETRLILTDQGGQQGEDFILDSFTLDYEPPTIKGAPSPAEGANPCGNTGAACIPRPTIVVGHGDTLSGVDPVETLFWVDNSSQGWSINAGRSLTTASPNFDLLDGRHDWGIEIQDAAGNWVRHESYFVIDTGPPRILDPRIEKLAANLAVIGYETSEPARCTTATTDGAATSEEARVALSHHAVLGSLQPSTRYAVTARCVDGAGVGLPRDVLPFETPACPECSIPVLAVSVLPPVPDGEGGWYVAAAGVTLSATADVPDSTFWISNDGEPFVALQGPIGALTGVHDVRIFALSPGGASSPVQARTLRFDPTPPPAADAAWAPTLGLLSWSLRTDAESGPPRFEVLGRTNPGEGEYQLLATVQWPGHRFEELPAGIREARVDAVNPAGLRAVGPPLDVGPPQGERVYTLANVVERTVELDDAIRINYRLGASEIFLTAALVEDDSGVRHPFSSTRQVEPHLFQANERAASFGLGEYRAHIEIQDAEGRRTTIEAGHVAIVPKGSTGPEGTREPCVVGEPDCEAPPIERDTPGFSMLFLAVSLLLGLAAVRRPRA